MATPDELIADARSHADELVSDSRSAMNDAVSMLGAVGYVIPVAQAANLPAAPSPSITLEPPELEAIELEIPADPSETLVFQDIPALELGDEPTLGVSAPTLVMPTAPSPLAEFTEAAPEILTDLDFPEPPDALMNPMIEAPVLPDREEPDAPQVLLPVLDAVAPTDAPATPTDYDQRFIDAHAGILPQTVAMLDGYVDAMLAKVNPRFHEQMARIETQLSTYLDGGTGLAPAVESQIYERAKAKTDAEARRVIDASYAEAADRGFTIPAGAVQSAVQTARQNAANLRAAASREITVMQAEMEQKNLQFAVTTSAGLRTSLLNATLSYHQNLITINGQAIEYAKSILSALVEVYNTAVKAFGLKLDAYRAEAAVYETRLKSAMAGIELYRIQIQALEALTNVDRAKVDVYRARIDALNSLSAVYRSQIEAVLGRASLEKMKLELFQVKVQAYSAQVQGKNSEWQGYTASVNGQEARAKLFGAQVDAFTARVGGWRASIEGRAKAVEAAALTNKARAEQHGANIAAFSAIVNAKGEVARVQLENQRQEIVAFQAQAQAEVARAQVANEYYRSVSQVAISNAEQNLRAQIQHAESVMRYGALVAQLGQFTAKTYADLAAASMSGMNSLAASTVTA